jgi:hypothetical protein
MFKYVHKDRREGTGRSVYAALGTAEVTSLSRLRVRAWEYDVRDHPGASRLAVVETAEGQYLGYVVELRR